VLERYVGKNLWIAVILFLTALLILSPALSSF